MQLQQQAAAKLYQRRQARKGILSYANFIDVPGKPVADDVDDQEIFSPVEAPMAAHHKLILNKMSEISVTPFGRLMIFCPPGAAKSTYASIVFPSYYLGSAPKRKIILASYGDDLARKMGRRTRSIIRQNKYKTLFGTELMKDSQSAQEFQLTNESEYMACGIMAGVTGNRAHGLICDDPIKGREQADSETVRQKTWDAYQDDLLTRLIPGGWVTLIQTRWHQLDLAGRILPNNWAGESGKILCKDGMTWDVLCLQARCEVENDPLGRVQGEYLWPEWFSLQHWAQFESMPRTWAALFQQLPSPREGDFFKPEMIEILPAAPAGFQMSSVRAWDLAASKDDGDWTVGVKMHSLTDGRTFISDIVRFQGGPDEVEKILKNTAMRDGVTTRIHLPQDPGQAGKAQVARLAKLLVGYNVVSAPVSGAKPVRAGGFAAQVNVGNVCMLQSSCVQDFIEELRVFPNGRDDDQVDAASDAFNELYGVDSMFDPQIIDKCAI